MPNARLIDISRHVDAVVPKESKNALGIRVWRDLIDTIQRALDDAVQGINDAGNALVAAQNAQNDANTNTTDIGNLTTDQNQLRTDFDNHETLQADVTVLGHVFKATPVIILTAPPAGAAPAAYSQVYVQSLETRIEDLVNQVADLNTKLQIAGVVS